MCRESAPLTGARRSLVIHVICLLDCSNLIKSFDLWAALVRGFNEEDLDIGDTYAATLQAVTVRLLFAWAVQRGYYIRQADISSAFLNSPMDREVYVLQPTGFTTGRNVCKLSRSLYGLRTAPKDWYTTFAAFLTSIGFTVSKFDRCLFFRGEMALSVFVDDINVFGPDDKENEKLLQTINSRFKLRDMGPVSRYLGMEVTYNRTAGTLSITQSRKIIQLLEDAQLTSCIPRKSPLDPGTTLPFATRLCGASHDRGSRAFNLPCSSGRATPYCLLHPA